ncbi:MAG: MGMT family protein, partial [Acidobacteria bacterium]|nr:MGMT family protein [Acidobacteriota bacterium]
MALEARDRGASGGAEGILVPEQSRLVSRLIEEAVWRIPKGKVSTYGDVARAAGYPRAARRVAAALRGAPPGCPWHRVLGAGGRILLRGESGLEQ